MRLPDTDEALQAYRLRMCARMDELWTRFPGEDNEVIHTRWCNAHNAYYKRYAWAEDVLIERGVTLKPIPPATE